MSSVKNKRRKKKSPTDTIIKALIVACVVTALALVGLLVAELISPDTTDTDPTETTALTVENNGDELAGEDITTEAADETTEQETTEQETTEQATTEATTEATTQEETTQEKLDFELTEPSTSATLVSEGNRKIINPDQDLWNLVVVNGTRAMPEGYKPQLKSVAGTDVMLDYRVVDHYTEMYNAAKKDGITLTPYSGYRSYDRQKRNYNNLTEEYMYKYNLSREDAAVKAATVILPPGTSEHNLGLAMDICNTNSSFAQQKEYRWLMEHAHKYGFILRYTAEKQPITGIIPEPWHWRYVGVEYAEDIKNSGLCLEEWLDAKGIAY